MPAAGSARCSLAALAGSTRIRCSWRSSPTACPSRSASARRCDSRCADCPCERSADGVVVAPRPALAGRNVVIVDDGVETGTVARAAAAAMAESGVASVILAVPVCSRESMASLQHRYDQVVALVASARAPQPAWHFDDFDTIDEATALALLADLPGE